jgi:hypothetical protein
MKRYFRFAVPALACAAGLLVGVAVAQDGGQDGGAGMGMPTPAWAVKGKEHDVLKKMVGTWDAQATMGGAPVGPGKGENALILGGNFLEQTYKGQMGPVNFEGKLILGYDTLDKAWVSIWIDNMSPVFSISRGTEKDGVVTFKTNDPDMMDPSGKRKEGTMTVTWTGDNSYTVAMSQGGGMEFKIVYTKK